MKNIAGWVFVYNEVTNTWLTTTRDHYFDLFNGNKEFVLQSGDIATLIEIIDFNDGNIHQVIKWKKQFR